MTDDQEIRGLIAGYALALDAGDLHLASRGLCDSPEAPSS